MKILNRFFLFCFLFLSGSGAFAQDTLPLSDIFSNLPGQSFADVESEARRQADRNPYYKSNAKEELVFEGYFKPNDSTAKLAILSDDGANVYLDGQKVHIAKGQGQHLPDLKQSLHQISTSLKGGKVYRIRVEYSNITLTSDTDIDGVTLFAFGSGGTISDIEPYLRVVPSERSVLPGEALSVDISVLDSGDQAYDVTVEGPGQITPNSFVLREGEVKTVMVKPLPETGEYQYQVKAVPQGRTANEASTQNQTSTRSEGMVAMSRGKGLLDLLSRFGIRIGPKKTVVKPPPKPAPPKPKPTPKPKPKSNLVYIYRGLGRPAAPEFVVDTDGVSTFERKHLPPGQLKKKFLLGFIVRYQGQKKTGTRGTIVDTTGFLAGGIAIYTPPPLGHWSIQLPDRSAEQTSDALSQYATHMRDNKIPLWIRQK